MEPRAWMVVLLGEGPRSIRQLTGRVRGPDSSVLEANDVRRCLAQLESAGLVGPSAILPSGAAAADAPYALTEKGASALLSQVDVIRDLNAVLSELVDRYAAVEARSR